MATPDAQNTQSEAEREEINKWLPITANRNAKWYYSTFHNVTAVVGAGVLGLPYAMSQLGWIPGLLALSISWIVTFYSFWQLIHMHEMVPGKRFDRYSELGEYAYGPTVGYWMVTPQQLIVQVATDIVYMVTGGKSLKKSCDMLHSWFSDVRQTYFILVFAFIQLVLSQVPDFNSLKIVSLAAAVMSFAYSMIAFVASIIRGTENRNVSYGVRAHTKAGIVFDVFSSLGTIAFAFAGHSVALEIQATIPSPSKKPMWRGVVVAYIIVAICYFCVSVGGFWAFGDQVDDDVLVTLEKPDWLIIIANFMVFIHVLGSYQVFAIVVFDKIESYLLQVRKLTPGRPLRLITRSTYVAATAFIGILLPFFGGLLGFFGGLAFSSTSYFLPCIFWLALKKPKRWSFHWFASYVCILIGVLITILAPIGGLRTIIVSASTYKMFT
ncbi:hypothetical protein DCAR_0416629 [Daucus carota subsp. sativus]|uniref:Amino acid transporter transmembrane domain-containing protein n=1 Tax=Daucus carota subsp. sativus TaxID=79200 RepID=A0AAF1AW90_DAUCS|nr:PREDICTED: lysine histidine transporter-like 5 [Daucus carota subsp. sativus]WOG97289.1 hypothetical protein DCAR_0416629 [Daucus carota subsp. sativus]